MPTRLPALLTAAFILCSIAGQAQNLRLENAESGKQILLKKGKRIACFLYADTVTRSGYSNVILGKLTSVGEDYFTIGKRRISMSNVRAIGRRTGGSIGWGVVFCVLGTSGLLDVAFQDEMDQAGAGNAFNFFLSGGLLGLGISMITRNSAREVGNGTWILEPAD